MNASRKIANRCEPFRSTRLPLLLSVVLLSAWHVSEARGKPERLGLATVGACATRVVIDGQTMTKFCGPASAKISIGGDVYRPRGGSCSFGPLPGLGPGYFVAVEIGTMPAPGTNSDVRIPRRVSYLGVYIAYDDAKLTNPHGENVIVGGGERQYGLVGRRTQYPSIMLATSRRFGRIDGVTRNGVRVSGTFNCVSKR